jgi:annexin A7/11
MATLKPTPGFDAETDAKRLRDAMKGFGTDEKTIVDVLGRRTAAERQAIALKFKVLFGKDLEADLKSELSGHLEDVCVALLKDAAHFDAWCVRKAMKGAGTDERCLIDVLCTRTNAEIAAIKTAYAETYQRDLEKDIVAETSGHFRRLLVSSVQGARSEAPVDPALAKTEAQELYDAGPGQWGTDESKFNQVFCLRSYVQLRQTLAAYVDYARETIDKTIEREFSGNNKRGLLALAWSAVDVPQYFAGRLHEAMHGAGTDDDTLIAIIVSRSEKDLAQIKQRYLSSYGKTLAKRIGEDCSGKYKTLLQTIVGE